MTVRGRADRWLIDKISHLGRHFHPFALDESPASP